MAKAPKQDELIINPIESESFTFHVVGTAPLIYNAVSSKAQRELLMPRGRAKTDATRASRGLKHDPMAEYRSSVYKTDSDESTRLMLPTSMLKAAICQAALRLPEVSKTAIGQLVFMNDLQMPIFGVPQIYTNIMRNSDINRTPDPRTRAIVPRWCTKVTVNYVVPLLKLNSVANLVSAAGILCGFGDSRQQKGHESFGTFHIVPNIQDPEYAQIVKMGGRIQQDEALADPECFDLNTQELLLWFNNEIRIRGEKTKDMNKETDPDQEPEGEGEGEGEPV